MIKRVLLSTALMGVALSVPARAGTVDDAMYVFVTLHKNIQDANEKVEDYEMEAAKSVLNEAKSNMSKFSASISATQSNSESLSRMLGDTWDAPVNAASNLSSQIDAVLSGIDSGAADLPRLMAAADEAESQLDTARVATKTFGERFVAFKAVTLADMRKAFDTIGPVIENARIALKARNGVEAQRQIAIALSTVGTVIDGADDGVNETTAMGDVVINAYAKVKPALEDFEESLLALQVVAGKSNPDSALSAVTSAEDVADKALNEADGRVTEAQGRFVLICDSACR